MFFYCIKITIGYCVCVYLGVIMMQEPSMDAGISLFYVSVFSSTIHWSYLLMISQLFLFITAAHLPFFKSFPCVWRRTRIQGLCLCLQMRHLTVWQALSDGDGHFRDGRSGPRDERWDSCGCHAALPDGTCRSKRIAIPWRWSHLIHRWHSIPAATTRAHFSALASVAVWVLLKSNLSF